MHPCGARATWRRSDVLKETPSINQSLNNRALFTFFPFDEFLGVRTSMEGPTIPPPSATITTTKRLPPFNPPPPPFFPRYTLHPSIGMGESWRSHGGVIQTWFGVTMSASGMILDLYSPTSSVESRGVGHTGQRARARGFGRVGARGGRGVGRLLDGYGGGGTGYMGSADPLETIGVMGCALCRCFGRVVRPAPSPSGTYSLPLSPSTGSQT